MYGSTINKKLQKFKHFRGVYSWDCIPYKLKAPSSLVVNLDSHVQRGSHWIAIFVGKNVEYFDSFLRPPPKRILKELKRFKKKIVYNRFMIQSPVSTACGMFIIWFIRMRDQGYTFRQIVHLFKTKVA